MTSEEIKQVHSMREIVEEYGLHPNRSGFIPCPFHKENTASMKIYQESYYCFGCGASGDIFTFVQEMTGQSFKEVYISFGGTYKHESFQDKVRRYHAIKARELQKKKTEKVKERKKLNNELINIYREWFRRSEPFSDTWTDCYNRLQYQLYLQEILTGGDEAAR